MENEYKETYEEMKQDKIGEPQEAIIPYNEDILPKSRKLGRIKGHLLRSQRIAYNVFLKVAYDNLLKNPSYEKFEIPIRDFCEMAGFDYESYHSHLFYKEGEEQKSLEILLRELLTKVYRVEWRNEKGETYQVLNTTLLSLFRMNKETGKIEFGFSSFIRDLILTSGNYYLLRLSVITSMSHTYSIALWEQILQRKEFGKWQVDIKDCRELMGVEEEKYKYVWDFEKRIIEPAVEEINKIVPGINLTYKKIKEKKKVVGYEFTWDFEALIKFKDELLKGKELGKEKPSRDFSELINLFPEKEKEQAPEMLKIWLNKYNYIDVKDAIVCASQHKPDNFFAYVNALLKFLPISLIQFRKKQLEETLKEEKWEQLEKEKAEETKEWLKEFWWSITTSRMLETMSQNEVEVLKKQAMELLIKDFPNLNNVAYHDFLVKVRMKLILKERLEQLNIKPPEDIKELQKFYNQNKEER
jgi:hypothetical protein